MAYAVVAMTLGYMLRVDSPKWIISVAVVNLPFYSMEIRHCLCRHFKMIIGEIGPVELELIFTIILVLSGGVFGCDVYESHLTQLTGLDWEFL